MICDMQDNMKEMYISISDMAELHGLTRRTLLYYDKVGIFKPDHINEKGYRYYSIDQIPFLREICFLRKLNFTLEEIQEYINNRTPEMAMAALKEKNDKINSEIKELQKTSNYINQRMNLLDHMDLKYHNIDLPYVKWYPERKVIFQPFQSYQMDHNKLHQTLMKAWRQIQKDDMIPACGFGAILRTQYINSDTPLRDAGSIINLPSNCALEAHNMIILPEGEYVTMYKFGMPYNIPKVKLLMDWIQEKKYKVKGDIIDMCLLDTTFYNEEHKEDFCMLQIKIDN